MINHQTILDDYKDKISLYKELTKATDKLIRSLLAKENICKYIKVFSRTKEIESLKAKLNKKPEKYSILSDIRDLTGIRIACYMKNKLDEIVSIIKREFDVIETKDHMKKEDPTSFGYTSVHLIVKYNSKREILAEYSTFRGILFEIQTCTNLMHTWAEIEHDLGYKTDQPIDPELIRKFSICSALLECADNQFAEIISISEAMKDKIKKDIKKNRYSFNLNRLTVSMYLHESKTVNRLDNYICKITNGTKASVDIGNTIITILDAIGINDLDNLQNCLIDDEVGFKLFVNEYLTEKDKSPNKREYPTGISIYYYAYYYLVKYKNENSILEYLNRTNLVKEENRISVSNQINQIYSKICKMKQQKCLPKHLRFCDERDC